MLSCDWLRTVFRQGAILWCAMYISAFNPQTGFAQEDDALNGTITTNYNTLTLDGAVQQALAANPSVAAMQARAQALAELPNQQGALPDPQLSLNLSNFPVDTFSLSQEPMTQIQLGIAQSLPYSGKLGLRQQAAELDANAAEQQIDELKIQLSKDVKSLWWNLYYLDRALEIIALNQDLLRQFVATAQTKYKVGKGLQQDVLLAQLELSKLMDSVLQLKAMRKKEQAKLNTLLDQPPHQPLVLPAEANQKLPELLQLNQLLALAVQARPLLAVKRHQVEAAETRKKLAERNYYPDFKVGAIYGYRDGNNADGSERADFVSLLLSVNLPINSNSRLDHQVKQRELEHLQSKFALQDSNNEINKSISVARADYEQALKQIQLLRDGMLPQARQAVESMLAGYQVNKVDFLSLLKTQASLYEFETQYWRVYSFAHQALARLSAAVGKELSHE